MALWQKGVSGNPGGRAKADPDLRTFARAHTRLAIETLVAILKKPKARDGDKIRAAEAILDRGHGKAPQAIEIDGQTAIQLAGDVVIRRVAPDGQAVEVKPVVAPTP